MKICKDPTPTAQARHDQVLKPKFFDLKSSALDTEVFPYPTLQHTILSIGF